MAYNQALCACMHMDALVNTFLNVSDQAYNMYKLYSVTDSHKYDLKMHVCSVCLMGSSMDLKKKKKKVSELQRSGFSITAVDHLH